MTEKQKPQQHQPVILLTGSGSGIGLALSELLYKEHQLRVVITARITHLEKLHMMFKESDRFLIRSLDINSATERKFLIEEIKMLWGGVDVLINNAAISYRSVVEHMSDEEEFSQMQTNYFGPMALIRSILPIMRANKSGRIINISSVSGMFGMPTMASYSASKHALEGASEALWYEMRPFGIQVSLVQPGFINSSAYHKVVYSEKSKAALSSSSPYCVYYHSIVPFISRLMNMSLSTPKSVADIVLRTVKAKNPPLWVPATIDATVFYYLRRIMPRQLFLTVLYRLLPRGLRYISENELEAVKDHSDTRIHRAS